MTFNQFKKLDSPLEITIMINYARNHCNRLLDQMDSIAKKHWRQHPDNIFASFRPTDAKVNREYDYALATWKFLHRLKTKLENAEMEMEAWYECRDMW